MSKDPSFEEQEKKVRQSLVDSAERAIALRNKDREFHGVDGKYDFYRPEEDMREGHDCYTDEPLYGLESNQFYAIVMECRLYNYLNDECLLDIEAEIDIFYPKRFEQEDDDSYLFLFQDFYNFQYERSKIYDLNERD